MKAFLLILVAAAWFGLKHAHELQHMIQTGKIEQTARIVLQRENPLTGMSHQIGLKKQVLQHKQTEAGKEQLESIYLFDSMTHPVMAF